MLPVVVDEGTRADLTWVGMGLGLGLAFCSGLGLGFCSGLGLGLGLGLGPGLGVGLGSGQISPCTETPLTRCERMALAISLKEAGAESEARTYAGYGGDVGRCSEM